MQRYDLWAVPLFEFQWPEHDRYRDDLKAVCDQLNQQQHVSGVSESIKSGLYESGFDFVQQPDHSVQAWKQWITQRLYEVAVSTNVRYWPQGCNIAVEIHESWCHITQDGGYHDRHVHPNSSWSAIYYLDPGESDVGTANGVNRFYNPNSVMYSDGGTQWCSSASSADIEPREGSLIVFPSWVQHSAMLYRGAAPRYILSCNCQIKILT
jgi:uncharacterized protein (TIGR02466 family)